MFHALNDVTSAEYSCTRGALYVECWHNGGKRFQVWDAATKLRCPGLWERWEVVLLQDVECCNKSAMLLLAWDVTSVDAVTHVGVC